MTDVKLDVKVTNANVSLDIVEQKLKLSIGEGVEISLDVTPEITSAILQAISNKMKLPKTIEMELSRLASGVQKKMKKDLSEVVPSSFGGRRRTSDEIQNVADRILAHVRMHPGITMLNLQEALGLQSGEGHQPMATLLGNGSVKKRGERSHTKYFAKK